MGFNLFKFLVPKTGRTRLEKVVCSELYSTALEYQIRELCFWVCVDFIANVIGRCEFRTFLQGKEVFDREYYMWNFEPNVNQNSTAFLHKLVGKLCQDNEALLISPRKRDGYSTVVVVDDWQVKNRYATRQNEYCGVTVDGFQFNKTFREEEVLHLQLRHMDLQPVLQGMFSSYARLLQAAMQSYEWSQGQHWKVTVNQMLSGQADFAEAFQKMIQEQIKPFLDSRGAILPEFDGYKYENVGGGKNGVKPDTRDIKAMIDDIFDFTAKAFQLPAVLINGKVEGVEGAKERAMSHCIDPICDQLAEEITRKRYGFDGWRKGNFVRVDSSAIEHFNLFGNAANVEKLVGSAAFTVNDILRAAGQPQIEEPWASKHFLTKNIADLEEAIRTLDLQEGAIP